MRLLAIVAIVVVVAGCATQMKTYEFARDREFAASRDVVWSQLMDYFTRHNIQIKTIEKDSGVVYAERSYGPADKEFSAFADCGIGPGTNPAGRGTISFNVFVTDGISGQDKTRVTVNSIFEMPVLVYAVFANVPEDRLCNSKGILEKQILDHLGTG